MHIKPNNGIRARLRWEEGFVSGKKKIGVKKEHEKWHR